MANAPKYVVALPFGCALRKVHAQRRRSTLKGCPIGSAAPVEHIVSWGRRIATCLISPRKVSFPPAEHHVISAASNQEITRSPTTYDIVSLGAVYRVLSSQADNDIGLAGPIQLVITLRSHDGRLH
ncbi:MAG: hypothetical protein M3456_01735, partial [Actinomycetota bacterium]|nr:hypothetical protein [Actinomycetota bacterium]